MAGEPDLKRPRLAEDCTFLELKEDYLKEDFVKKFKTNFMSCAKIPCRCLKFETTNAAANRLSYSFSQAYCDTTIYSSEYAFASFFEDGVVLLDKYVNDPKKVQASKDEGLLLERLLNFISDKENTERLYGVLQRSWVSEATITSTVAHHLISRLSLSPAFMIDHTKGVPNSDERLTCLCGCQEDINGRYGDTSYGNNKVWHGKADIFANGKEAAICVGDLEPDSADDSPGRSQVVKIDFKNLNNMEQLIAQTVCFSFLQGRRHTEFASMLVPCIGISSSEVVIYMYDSVLDKFIETVVFRLFDETKETLNMSSVIALWLALNYKVFSSYNPSITAFVKTLPSANFFMVAKSKLHVYRKELQFGRSQTIHAQPKLYRRGGQEQEEELQGSEKIRSLGITKK